MDMPDKVVASNCSAELNTNGNYYSKAAYNHILDKVANNKEAFFKSQQLGEKNFTFEEKREMVEDLLLKNVPLFLERYYKILKPEDLSYFENFKNDYRVSFYLEEIKKRCDQKKYRAVIKNRRYEALKKLKQEGIYFSDPEMRHRSPYLYEQFVGQYLTDAERSAMHKADEKDACFSGFLMQQIEKSNDERLLRMQENSEERAAIEQGVEDFSDEGCDSENEEEYVSDEEEQSSNMLMRREKLPDGEKERLRTEFTNVMFENFLLGKDKEFDYSKVDENVEYDSVQQREIDEEEKYFDDESAETLSMKMQNVMLCIEELQAAKLIEDIF